MPRLPNNEIDKLKNEVSLLRLVESQGYQPKKHGTKGDYVISCPFHDDKTPSMVISSKKNVFHCFGCGESGTVIDWVMKTQGVSFRHAVTVLQEDAGLVTEAKTVKRRTTKTLPPLAAQADDQKLLCEVIDYYHQTLKQSPEALNYLAKRGLKSSELIDTFKLGYANRTLAYRLPEKQYKAGKEIRTQLQAIG